jgi:sialidase-1
MTYIKYIFFCLISVWGYAQNEPPAFNNLFDAEEQPGIACYRIPALATAVNGTLIAAIDERVPSCGDLKWNRDINIVIRRSENNGKTWSAIKTVVDYPPGQSASDPSLIVDRISGEIILFFNFMDLDREKDVYYHRYIKSRDHGKTWSEPVDITAQISKETWKKDFKFISSGRGMQTQSGKLVHTLVNLEAGLHLFASDDHGRNWYLIDQPIVPGDESKVIELSDETWMVNSRINNGGNRVVHRSKDEGKTWISKSDNSLADPGCNASIINYASISKDAADRRLLFSNANHGSKRENMTVKISYDEGKTWSEGKTIYAGSAAYSSMTTLSNGDIGLLFEKDGSRQNVFVSFSLAWLTEGTAQGSSK